MIFELIDHGGSADVRLGARREDLQRAWGNGREIRRTPDSAVSEQFLNVGVMATFGADSRVSILEFADPADVRLGGVSVIGLSTEALQSHLRDVMHLDLIFDDETVEVPSWRMSFWLPDGVVEGVLLGK